MNARPLAVVAIALAVPVSAGCAPSESPEEQFAQEVATILDEGLFAEGDEWQDAREQLLAAAADADEVSDLLPAVRDALSVAGGEHSFLIEGADLNDMESDASVYPSAEVISPGVAVLTVPATTAQTVEDVAQYVEAGIAEREAIAADASCGWILDVRGNMGGNMFPMLAVVAPFLDTQTPLSWRTRDGVSSTVDVRDGRVEVTGDDDPYTVEFDPESIINEPPPTIVLQDDRTVSSGEAIVAAFLGQQGVLTVGQPTRGLSTSNSAFDLSDGSTVLLTTATFVTRDGVVLGSPIDPDVGTDAVGEKALAEAAALLRGSCA